MKIFKTVEVSVDIDPDDLAEVFWEMDSKQQARFFNNLADLAPPSMLSGQMRWVSDSGELTELGRKAVESLWRGVE